MHTEDMELISKHARGMEENGDCVQRDTHRPLFLRHHADGFLFLREPLCFSLCSLFPLRFEEGLILCANTRQGQGQPCDVA